MARQPAVLITGCSSGIGHAAALRLVRAGRWTVYATARRSSSLSALAAAGCRTLDLDVTDDVSMQRAVQAIEEAHGALGALVNNAGYSQSGAVEAVPIARVRAQFETNVFGLLRLTQLVLPEMRRARAGRIVNIGSMGGRLVFPGGGVYHATKYALEALSDALRFEVRGFGVQVVLIEPGLIRTGFGDAATAALRGVENLDSYGAFHAEVARLTKEASERGVTSRLAGTADDVAATIEKALTSPSPRARYTVSPSAALFIGQRRLGDRAWDAFLRRIYPSPGTNFTGGRND
jgi:NAD(P)-dependent dehydrogenase (short-subunit alcohol dehydrogenase family)